MSTSDHHKIAHLLSELPDGLVVNYDWLRVRGYSRPLVDSYVLDGWIRSPAQGFFTAADSSLTWLSVLSSMQWEMGYEVHVGGRAALELAQGLSITREITLMSSGAIPTWTNELGLPQRFHFVRPRRLGLPNYRSADGTLSERGLQEVDADRPVTSPVVSMPERAMLEMLLEVPDTTSVVEADSLMRGLGNLDPQLATSLLRQCRSVKAKRLFLALAERHKHPWVRDVPIASIDLGNGLRDITPGGVVNSRYKVTLPFL